MEDAYRIENDRDRERALLSKKNLNLYDLTDRITRIRKINHERN